jgi:hypothetical protein
MFVPTSSHSHQESGDRDGEEANLNNKKCIAPAGSTAKSWKAFDKLWYCSDQQIPCLWAPQRPNLPRSTATFLGVSSILPLRSCSISRGEWTPGHRVFLTVACGSGMNQLTHQEGFLSEIISRLPGSAAIPPMIQSPSYLRCCGTSTSTVPGRE